MFELASILPLNSTRAERALEAAIRKSRPDLSVVAKLMDPDTCPSHLLGWLAWALSVDEWDIEWSIDTKRNVLRLSVLIHRRKGTVWSIKNALTSAGYGNALVIEDFGRQFHNGAHLRDGSITRAAPDHWAEYRVVLTRPITINQAAQVRRILSKTAPVRSHLKALDFTEALNLHNNTIIRDGSFTRGIA